MEITMDKRYRTRDGHEAQILKVGARLPNGMTVVGLVVGEAGSQALASWYSDGWYHESREPHDFDLIEVTLQVDDKVMVKRSPNGGWFYRRFAGFDENGDILVWKDGTDSWVCRNNLALTSRWSHWRLPTAEELK